MDLETVVILSLILKMIPCPCQKLLSFMLLGKTQLRGSSATPSTKKMKTKRSQLSMKSEVLGMLGKAYRMLLGL